MKFRRMTIADISAVVRMIRGERAVEDFPGEYSSKFFKHALRTSDAAYIVSDIDGELAGLLEYELVASRGMLYVVTVIVAKRFRGKGVGSALLKYAEEQARKKKLTRVGFLVRSWNKDMQRLAQKRGYVGTDKLVFFKKRVR